LPPPRGEACPRLCSGTLLPFFSHDNSDLHTANTYSNDRACEKVCDIICIVSSVPARNGVVHDALLTIRSWRNQQSRSHSSLTRPSTLAPSQTQEGHRCFSSFLWHFAYFHAFVCNRGGWFSVPQTEQLSHQIEIDRRNQRRYTAFFKTASPCCNGSVQGWWWFIVVRVSHSKEG
jgi:hypothetical protein